MVYYILIDGAESVNVFFFEHPGFWFSLFLFFLSSILCSCTHSILQNCLNTMFAGTPLLRQIHNLPRRSIMNPEFKNRLVWIDLEVYFIVYFYRMLLRII